MFSQKVEYALRAVAYLASKPGGARTVEQIAKGTKVPPAYLAKVIQELVHAGIARSQRGIGGGITLAKPADELTFKRHRLRLRLHHGNLRGRRRRRALRAGGEHDQTQIRQRRALRT